MNTLEKMIAFCILLVIVGLAFINVGRSTSELEPVKVVWTENSGLLGCMNKSETTIERVSTKERKVVCGKLGRQDDIFMLVW